MYSVGGIAFNIILNGGKKAASSLKGIEKGVIRIGKAGKEVNQTFNSLVRLLGFAGMTHMVIETSKMGRSMELLSDQTGVAASELSKLKTAFSAAGVGGNKLDSILQRINKEIQDTTLGLGTGRLAGAHINVRDEYGRLKTPVQVLREISGYAKEKLVNETPQTVSNLLATTFGIDQQMANILMKGPDYFDDLISKSADRLGSLSDRQISNLSELQKSIDELTTTAKNTGKTIMGELAPELKSMADAVVPVMKYFADKFSLKQRNNISNVNAEMLGRSILLSKNTPVEQKILALEKAGIKDVRVRGSKIKLLGPDGKWTTVDANDVYSSSIFSGLGYFNPANDWKNYKGRVSAPFVLSDFAEKRKEILGIRERLITGAYSEDDVNKAQKYGMITNGEADSYRGVLGISSESLLGDDSFENQNKFNRAMMLASYGNSQQPIYLEVNNEINQDQNGNTNINTTASINGENQAMVQDYRTNGVYNLVTGQQ